MPELAFKGFRPDISDLNTGYTKNINNVLPRLDGYGPIRDLSSFTDAMPAACRGYFYARKASGAISIFAGTSTKLYLMNNTDYSWDDVSQGGGTYSAVSSDAQWQFVQFNNYVIAAHENVAPQVYDLTSSSEFADLGGSPPQAAYIAVVGRFIVLSGLLSQPYRVQWSGLNATTTWTSGTNFSDFQDLPDGGVVRGVAGGEYGLIMQDQSIRRMIYSPGSEIVFQIDRVAQDRGMLAPYSLIPAGDKLFFLSAQGFIQSDASGQLVFIGKEQVDRTFFTEYNSANPQLMIGVADPSQNVVLWCYQSNDGAIEDAFNKALIYDWSIKEWSQVDIYGQYAASLATPGLTLENLDDISSSLDALPFSLDDVSTSTLPALSFSSTSNIIGYLTGDNMEATLETSEFSQLPYRTEINGVTPITDASTVAVSIGYRDNLNSSVSYGSESTLNDDGYAPLLEEGRYVKAKIRIPAASDWTFVRGVEPDFHRGSML